MITIPENAKTNSYLTIFVHSQNSTWQRNLAFASDAVVTASSLLSSLSFSNQAFCLVAMQETDAVVLKIRCKMADSLTTPAEAPFNFAGRGKFIHFSSRTGKRILSARTPWLSRRHTPYVKTPKTGRTSQRQTEIESVPSLNRRTTLGIEKNVSTPRVSKSVTPSNSRIVQKETQTKDLFHDIVGKTLRVFQASPLYKFDFSNVKNFAEQLSKFLQLETEKQLFVEANGEFKDQKYKTDIFVFKEISGEETKLSAVKITVENFTSKPTQAKSNSTAVLTAMFCFVGKEEAEDPRFQDHFTCLPVCLIKGPVDLARSMICWFEQKFDCRITPMTFSSMELGWYFSLWAGMSSPGKSVPIELSYDASNVNGLSRILFSIEQKDAKELWGNIHSSGSLIFTEEESITFLKALESHFYHHFRINLEGLPVTRVRTAIAYIASEGKLKIVHPHYADHILEQLTRAALTKEFYGRL